MKTKSIKYFDRDLSWLRFNQRVLQEVKDERNPIYERLKFAAIFSSNLDEFFEVRIAEIRRIKSLDKPLRKKLISKPNRLLKSIKKGINNLEEEFDEVLYKQLIPQLETAGVRIILSEQFDDTIIAFCREYFASTVKSRLQFRSNFVTEDDRLFIKPGDVCLASQEKDNLILFKLPNELPRFIEIPESKVPSYIFIDDLIKICLREKHKYDFYSLTISRDAELYILDEYSGNLKEKIAESLTNRETGQISTAVIDRSIPKSLQKLILKDLDISDIDIVYGGRFQKLRDFFSFPFPHLPEFKFKKIEPIRSAELTCHNCLFKAIREKDRVLFFPYESFKEVLRLVEEAASGKEVQTIKVTLYRVSKESKIAMALLKAVKKGKDVCVFIETKARFDESNNIYWGEKLKAAGANVIYSYPGIKVHSKILYIERNELLGKRAYGYIGTGNFNENTAKVYTDIGLMTADKKLTKELSQIFEVLEGKLIVPKVKRLLVSPFNTRATFLKLIEKEIQNAQLGKEAYIILKMNSLQDKAMIYELYKASQSGVIVKLIVRGICCLVPGIKGLSENIKVISIVDRFLEHSRVYIFANGGDEKMYIGSADWMTRNLDHRIEVLVHIKDKEVYHKIFKTIDLQLSDNVKARIIDSAQENNYINIKVDYTNSSQHLTYNFLKELSQKGHDRSQGHSISAI